MLLERRSVRNFKSICLLVFFMVVGETRNYHKRLYGERQILRTRATRPVRRGEAQYYRARLTKKHIPTVTQKVCLNIDTNALRARHKSCFLRPDTGPCRADIVQWYFDVRQGRCYRFFWGGCQGNGNRFGKWSECHEHCFLNESNLPEQIPNFCHLTFEYGTCFGSYQRWGFDQTIRQCRKHLYSGCGGNQNNFQTRMECIQNCIHPPNNTLQRGRMTTCIPLNMEEFQ